MSIEAMKQALEALVSSTGELRLRLASPTDAQLIKNDQAITALKQAIAEVEKQEPVIGTKTWFEDGKMVTQHLHPSDIYAIDISQKRVDETAKDRHDLTCVCGAVWVGEEMVCSPRKRKWVGLTIEEVAGEFYKFEAAGAWYQFANAIEAKLKEKNT